MLLQSARIKNFRLLTDVELVLEDKTTLVVGRNNSGKTSLSEVMRRFLKEGTPRFQLEDFSSSCFDHFGTALDAFHAGEEEDAIRQKLPHIELRLVCVYDTQTLNLGPLAPFIIDLDPNSSTAIVILRYELEDGGIKSFFADTAKPPLNDQARIAYFKQVRERIQKQFTTNIWAEDPSDTTNRRSIAIAALRDLVKTGFINAQRGLDDVTTRESDILATVLEGLFTKASSPNADQSDKVVVEALTTAVEGIQREIDKNFVTQLRNLMPALQTFGYPGLGGQELHTETTLEVGRLLSNFTKVRYAGYGGIALPESYNGLGIRNLIFILLQLASFFKEYRTEPTTPGVHLIFIEEPEAHLHPQMQEVFIRQLDVVAKTLANSGKDKTPWNVQFVVSTHSSHVANEAGFENIRYFLTENAPHAPAGVRRTKIKDLRTGLSGKSSDDKKFLRQYLTLTRCDLFFADKAALVEGLSERLLLPVMTRKLEEADPQMPKLSAQYMTIMEVGGAHAHIFFDLLTFLELRTLIVTDIDSVNTSDGKACEVHLGNTTSNACIKTWFPADDPVTLAGLLSKTDPERINGINRIAFQCPEAADGPCGRTFEDAFMLANAAKFGITGTKEEQEKAARAQASSLKKSDFALKYAVRETDWETPKYLADGIRWLADDIAAGADPVLALAVQAAVAPTKGP